MESKPAGTTLIAIVGQTASGKTALALDLAERFNGEIIAADSRTLYRGMDIGTAKPSPDEQARVKHHLIDIYDPDQRCTASDFQHLAAAAIQDIRKRGKVPFLVGGSGLYIDAVLFGFAFRGKPDIGRRRQLEASSAEELQRLLLEEGISLPTNARNPRHLIRTIETGGVAAGRQTLQPGTIIIGIDIEKEELSRRIVQRTDDMLNAGLEAEVASLRKRYGWECPPMQTIGYQEFQPYFQDSVDIQEVRQKIIVHTRQYAKRQKTWFKRNKSIHWINKTEEAVDLLTTKVNK